MKVITAAAMQEADRRAIVERGIPGLTLMENAGRGCVEVIQERFGNAPDRKAVILAGKGNNGGDGYVIARLLKERGWDTVTLVLASSGEIAGDARANLERLPRKEVHYCPEGITPFASLLTGATVIVDALLGTGLAKEVSGHLAEAIEIINDSGKPVAAVDIPSGIHGTSGQVLGTAVKATLTVTFACAKAGHVLYPGAEYTGKLRVVEIGIPASILAATPGYEFVDDSVARSLIRPRRRTAHKGSLGHVLIVAGSRGKTGAAAMAANSAVRAGSGLVTLAVPAVVHDILEVKTTEAMTVPLDDAGRGYLGNLSLPGIRSLVTGRNAVALGPGISWNPDTAAVVHQLVAEIDLPLVLDADALNALSEEPGLLASAASRRIILTPHPGEMSRLCGLTVAAIEEDRIAAAHDFAARYGVYLVLKGARTVCAAPDGRIAINASGNPGMATGGMGDVLTGILVSLLGQGFDPFDACRLGVFLHGYAADLVASDKGEIGIAATDVQERLPTGFMRLMNGPITGEEGQPSAYVPQENAMQTVGDIMTRQVITVTRETSVRELAHLFTAHRVGSIPVVDDAGNLLGIVTETDLIEQDKSLHIPTVISLFDWVIYLESDKKFEKELNKVTGQTAGDIFTKEVITLSPDEPVRRAADIMTAERVNAVPVVEGTKLVGIISRIDLIRTMNS